MSGAVKSAANAQLRRIIAQWPEDVLRPSLQLRTTLGQRLEGSGPAAEAWQKLDGAAQDRQANALRSLLQNRYRAKYQPSERLMRPGSRPTYYADLLRELEEAPTLTWWGAVKKRLGTMVSFS